MYLKQKGEESMCWEFIGKYGCDDNDVDSEEGIFSFLLFQHLRFYLFSFCSSFVFSISFLLFLSFSFSSHLHDGFDF